MEMASRHVLLFLLTLLFHASALYLGDYRRPKLRTLAEKKNGNLSDLDPENQKSHLSGQSRRAKENEKQSLPLLTGTYINCVFNTGSANQPDYDCKYSPDVNVNWTNVDGRLIGTMSTNFGCAVRFFRTDSEESDNPLFTHVYGRTVNFTTFNRLQKRRSVRNKMQSPQNEVGSRTWKQLIRDKRGTVYRDDAEAEDAPVEEAQQIEEEENVIPEVNQDVTEDEDITEDSQEPRPKDLEEGTPDEGDKRSPVETDKDDENKNKGLKNVQSAPSLKSEQGSEEDAEKEDNEVQEEVGDETDTGDTENGAEVEEEPFEDKVEEESEEDMDGQAESEKEGENDKGDDDKDFEDDNDNKPEADVKEGDIDFESILVPLQEDIDALLPETEMPVFVDFILDLLYDFGDYLISLLIKNLQERLRQGRISEKFERKVEMLSESYGNDTDKAIKVMEKKIHEQLGKSYQLKIVGFLHHLYRVWNQ